MLAAKIHPRAIFIHFNCHKANFGISLHRVRPTVAETKIKIQRRISSAPEIHSDAVLMAFNDIKVHDITNENMLTLRENAEAVRNKLSGFQRKVEREGIRTISGDDLSKLASAITTDREFIAFISSLAILRPQSESVWLNIDSIVSRRAKDFSLDTMALTSSVIIAATDSLRIRKGLLASTSTLAKLILRGKYELLPSEDVKTLDDDHQLRALEKLGVHLQILSRYCSEGNIIFESRDIERISDYYKAVMSTITIAVPLRNLELIWLSIPYLKPVFTKAVCSELYMNIHKSIFSGRYQIRNDEKIVLSLFGFMKLSKSTDKKLVSEICGLLDQKNFDFEKYGVNLFCCLAELDCIPQAMLILEEVLNGPIQLHKKSFPLTVDAKLCIFDQLSRTTGKYSNSDLILALYAFGMDKKDSKEYRMIETIEGEIASAVCRMQIRNVLNLLNAYCYCSRKYPGIIKAINGVVEGRVEELTRVELEKLLWANARLNNRTGCNQRAGDRLLSFTKSVNMGHYRFIGLVKSLWSLAVLEELTLEQYYGVEGLLVKKAGQRDGSELPPTAVQQLLQILFELRSKSITSPQDIPPLLGVNPDPQNIFGTRSWELERTKIVRPSAVRTSLTHKDVSKTLNEMGTSHSNETTIDDVYIVDILITDRVRVPPGCKGLVLELNGPTHYENYSNAPLGPTVMKKRHLAAAGYAVRTLPYWKYNMNHTNAQKRKALSDLLK